MFAVGLSFIGQPAEAQTPPHSFPLSATVTNGNITFSWPAIPGKWHLVARKPASIGEWTPVPPEQYQTNGPIISVSVPLPKETSLYQVRRNFGIHPTALPPGMPPAPPTNRPPGLQKRLQKQP